MSKKEKLVDRFLSMPRDFRYEEMVKLLGYYGFTEVTRKIQKKGNNPSMRLSFTNIFGAQK